MKSNLIKFFFLFAVIFTYAACSSDDVAELPNPDNRTVWNGPIMTFEKADGTDPQMAMNQDQISASVSITRGNDGGQIFNIQQEAEADKDASPRGTQWAVGTIDQIDNLNFQPFRDAVKPSEVVGKDLVLFLVDEDIFLSVKFTKWSEEKKGGFAYERSTQ